jgi:hypothetical protein
MEIIGRLDTAGVLIDTSSHMPAIGGRPIAPKVGILWGILVALPLDVAVGHDRRLWRYDCSISSSGSSWHGLDC